MTAPADIDALFQHLTHSEPQKLVVFFHGGLVNEEKGLAIAGKMWQAFRDHAYPVTFIWETGFLETLTNHLDSIHRTKLFQKILRLIISQATKRLSGVLGARGTAKIFMPHVSQGFNPSDRYTQVVDAAVTTLQQGGDFFPKDAIDFLLREKFYDPMLGLLGAHFLLRRADLRENYVHIVLDNLENLIPGSPDVQALRLMAAECLGWDIPRTPFDRAPILRPALEAVLRFSIDYPELTPEKGLLECIATRFYVDSPWTSWDLVGVCDKLYGPGGVVDKERFSSDWLATYLQEAIQTKLKWGREIDLKELARQVGVPLNLVSNVYEGLGGSRLIDQFREWGDDFKKIRGIGPAFESVLKDTGIRTYGDLAQMGQEKVTQVSSRLGRFASHLNKGDWIGQAKKFFTE